MGADLKYGITSNLTIDATVNPDFGQVEADPSVVNLSAFETFFPEKRPFFLEGQGLFRFDVNCNDGSCSGLFYSRRIGRAPQLSGNYDDPSESRRRRRSSAQPSSRDGSATACRSDVLDAVTQREIGAGDVRRSSRRRTISSAGCSAISARARAVSARWSRACIAISTSGRRTYLRSNALRRRRRFPSPVPRSQLRDHGLSRAEARCRARRSPSR